MSIQWKVTYRDGSCAPGTSNPVNLTFSGSDLLHDNTVIKHVTVYFIGSSETTFTVHIDGAPDAPFVGPCSYNPDTSANLSTTGGCTWSKPGNYELDVVFTGPDMDKAMEWIPGGHAPPVPLHVKIKRKGASNSGSCSGWAFP
jgi:hypothetical protein